MVAGLPPHQTQRRSHHCRCNLRVAVELPQRALVQRRSHFVRAAAADWPTPPPLASPPLPYPPS
eukprot:4790622-Pyramimonas_sp.AAC.1